MNGPPIDSSGQQSAIPPTREELTQRVSRIVERLGPDFVTFVGEDRFFGLEQILMGADGVSMLGRARAQGIAQVHLDSEPKAEGFYAAMGARRVGQVESKIVRGRFLPIMVVDVPGASGRRHTRWGGRDVWT